MPDAGKTVCVFVSSTFRDMHAERDHLVTVVFPELHERLDRLGLEFYDVDLRWGVPKTGADGERANSWGYCKRWIDRVEPFFVCILGQRYGYTPPETEIIDENDRKAYAGLSITEMEVHHAVLSRKLRRRSFFYFRMSRVPEDPRPECYADFVDAGERRLDNLKDLIGRTRRPIRAYDARWTGLGFDQLDAFGRLILEDLWSGVLRDTRYVPKEAWRAALGRDPNGDPLYTDESQAIPVEVWEAIVREAKPVPLQPLDAEAQQMAAFAAARLRWFQGRGRELQHLAQFVEGDLPAEASRLCVVRAAAGQGKSALLAKLADRLAASPHLLLTRFVGATERSADARSLLGHLNGDLERSGVAGPPESDPQQDLEGLRKRLAARLENYAGERRLILVIDGINQLTDGHDLAWLPHRFAPNVRLIVSCIDDPLLPAGGPEARVLAALNDRRPEPMSLDLKPLEEGDVRGIVIDYLLEYCKVLDREQIKLICGMEQARNPLYLMVMLHELRTLGGNDMNEVVPRLIAEMRERYPDTVRLFGWVLERLEVFGREAVRLWCSYLALGRVGMSSRELRDLLVHKLGPGGGDAALLIERGVRRYLQRRGPQLDFFHGQLREAVLHRYAPEDPGFSHADVARYLETRWREPDRHALSELPYHQTQGRLWAQLSATLSELPFLEARAEAGMVFDLAGDYGAALRAIPAGHSGRQILRLLEEALRRDIHFIARHPSTLFQCLWNFCWWYDCAEAAEHYTTPPVLRGDDPTLSALLESWRVAKEKAAPGFCWARSLRPPSLPLSVSQTLLLSGHSDSVTRVLFTPDGRRLVSASRDASIRVWDADSGQERACLEGHTEGVSGLACSPDGRLLASASDDNRVCVWDLLNGLRLHAHHVYWSSNHSLTFSVDGRNVLALAEEFHCWDARGGAKLSTLPHPCAGREAVFSPDGTHVVTVAWTEQEKYALSVCEVVSDREVVRFAGHQDQVCALAFSPDGTRVASGSEDRSVCIWDVATGALVARLTGPKHWILAVAFSPDGRRVAAGSWDHTVRIWDVSTGQETACLRGHQKQVGAVAFSPDGRRLASGGWDNTIRIWNAEGTAEPPRLHDHAESVVSLNFFPDGNRFVTNAKYERGAWVWDAAVGLPRAIVPHPRAVLRCACTPDGCRLVTACRDGLLRVWNVIGGELLNELGKHEVEDDLGLALAPDGRAAVSWGDWSDGTIRVWDLNGEGPRFVLESFRVHDVVFSPNGKLIAAGQQGERVHVWDALDGREVATFGAFEKGENVHCVAFSPDARHLAAGVSHSVRVWDLTSGEEVLRGERSDGNVLALAFSPDGARLFALADWSSAQKHGTHISRTPTVQVWDATQLGRPLILPGRSDVAALAAGPRWYALAGELETTLAAGPNRTPITWLPIVPELLRADPTGRVWAGAFDAHVFLFCLEGDPEATLARETGCAEKPEFHFPRSERRSLRGPRVTRGICWQRDDYACHEAVCPVCDKGEPYGSGNYSVDLRVYFGEGPPRSLERPIAMMRVVCGGSVVHPADLKCGRCGVGTGDGSGLYLLPHKHPDWGRRRVRAYLKALGSPFARHPSLEDIPDEDELQSRIREPEPGEVPDLLPPGEEDRDPNPEGVPTDLDLGAGWRQASGAERLAYLRWLPCSLREAERWEELERLLTDLDFLQARADAGLAFEQVADLAGALRLMPEGRPARDLLALLADILGRNVKFISRHPSALFQCLWNASTWPDDATRVAAELARLLGEWRQERERRGAAGYWLRSLRPLERPSGQEGGRMVLSGHTAGASSVVFAPSGGELYSGSYDATVRAWNGANGRDLFVLKGHEGAVNGVALSPDGRRLASVSEDATIRLWDAHRGRALTTLMGHQEGVFGIAFSPDGRLLASGSRDKTVRLWDVLNTCELGCFQGHADAVMSVAFSPDGLRLVSGSGDRTVKVWDRKTARLLGTCHGHRELVETVAFSPDGQLIASGSDDGTVHLWHSESCRRVHVLSGHQRWVMGVAFSPDGKVLASSSRDTLIRFWDVRSGRLLACLKGPEGGLGGIAFSADGRRLATAAEDWTVCVWDADSRSQEAEAADQGDWIRSIQFLTTGRLLISRAHCGSVRAWDVAEGRLVLELRGKSDRRTPFVWSSDGEQPDGDHTLQLRREDAPDGRTFATVSQSGDVILWDMGGRREVRRFCGHLKESMSLAFNLDGSQVVSSSRDGTVRVWEVATGEQRLCLEVSDGADAVGFAVDGRSVACATEEEVRIWDAQTGALLDVQPWSDGGTEETLVKTSPWRLCRDALDSFVEARATGEALAWWPGARGPTAIHPGGRIWAGAQGRSVHLFTLEGQADGAAARPETPSV